MNIFVSELQVLKRHGIFDARAKSSLLAIIKVFLNNIQFNYEYRYIDFFNSLNDRDESNQILTETLRDLQETCKPIESLNDNDKSN